MDLGLTNDMGFMNVMLMNLGLGHGVVISLLCRSFLLLCVYILIFVYFCVLVFMTMSACVVLIGDYSLGYIFHGNISNRLLPNTLDVLGFSKSGDWDETKLCNPVQREQSHSLRVSNTSFMKCIVYSIMGLSFSYVECLYPLVD